MKKNLSKMIAEIYYSDMSNRLKNDCICRLLCKEFDAVAVSMLHYQGAYKDSFDVLVCIGNFFNCGQDSLIFENDGVYKKILSDIEFYEYVHHKLGGNIDKSKIKYEHFSLWKYRNKKISKSKFTKLLEDIDKMYTLYIEYKNIFDLERYQIGKSKISKVDSYTNLSGSFFHEVVQRLNVNPDDIIGQKITVYDAPTVSRRQGVLMKVYKRIGLEKIVHKKWVGIPLIANKRCFGVLRILLQDDRAALIKKIENQIHIAQILSLFYGNQYSLDRIKKLNIEEQLAKEHYMEICEACRAIINCYGCMIRLFNESLGSNFIAGWTESVEDYKDELHKLGDHFLSSSSSPNNVLHTIFGDEKKITLPKLVGISFDLTRLNAIKNVKYFYLSDDEIIKKTSDLREIKGKIHVNIGEMFPPDRVGILRSHKIQNIAIMALPHLSYSYITFANTANRAFTNNDIEFMYPIVQRIGLEIERNQIQHIDTLLRSYTLFAKLLKHETNSIVGYIKATVTAILTKYPKDESAHLFLMYFKYIEGLIDQLSIGATYPIVSFDGGIEEKESYDLMEYITEEVIMSFAQFTKITRRIGIQIIPTVSLTSIYVKFDKHIMKFIFFILLSNARKYSYSDTSMPRGVIFSKNDITSDGHIKIHLEIIDKVLVIKVVNWGIPIEESELETIFDAGTRTKVAEKYQKGTGLGLYLAKQYLLGLDGEVKAAHDKKEKKTTFTVKIPL